MYCTSNRTPCIHPVFLLIAASVIAPPLLALGSVIVSSVHRIIASGTVLMALIFAAVVPENTLLVLRLLTQLKSFYTTCILPF